MIKIFHQKNKLYQLNFREDIYTDLSLKELEDKINIILGMVFEEGKDEGHERGIFEMTNRKIYFKQQSPNFTKFLKK